ncbi:hypothetical protein LG275_09660 [Chryseomicrobium palamuruense]
MAKMKTFLIVVVGLIGVSIGAALFAIENDGATFLTKFLFKLSGLLLFIGAIYFVQRYWKSLKPSN